MGLRDDKEPAILAVSCSDDPGNLGVVALCKTNVRKKNHRPLFAMRILVAFRFSRLNLS
jgi:hypothetical protein